MTWCLAHPKPIGNTCSWPHQRHHLHSCQKRNPGSNVSTSQINTCVYITSFKQRNKRERLLTYEQTYITISPRSLMVKMNTEEAVRAKFWRGADKARQLAISHVYHRVRSVSVSMEMIQTNANHALDLWRRWQM